MIAEKHSHDSVSSDNIIEQYNRYRYEFIKQHDFDARTAYDSIEDKGVTILTRLDRYADDLLDEFFRNVIYAAQSSTKEELRASAQIFIIDVKAYLNLMSLCKSCHSRIHAERGDRWRKK